MANFVAPFLRNKTLNTFMFGSINMGHVPGNGVQFVRRWCLTVVLINKTQETVKCNKLNYFVRVDLQGRERVLCNTNCVLITLKVCRNYLTLPAYHVDKPKYSTDQRLTRHTFETWLNLSGRLVIHCNFCWVMLTDKGLIL